MVNGAFDLSLAAFDLACEQPNALVEFGDRQAVEILAQQRGQRIVGPGPKDIVQVHKGER